MSLIILTRPLPADAVRLSRSSLSCRLLPRRQSLLCALALSLFFFCSQAAWSQADLSTAASSPAPRYVADIELHSAADLSGLLLRAEQMLVSGEVTQQQQAVVLVLHGPVLHSLLRPNYPQSKALVNQAASLSALGVLDVRACRSWMAANNIDEAQLQPFVGVVSSGAGEVTRLIKTEGYIAF